MSDEKAIEVSKKPELREIMRSDQIVQRFEEITGKGNAGGYISSVLIAVSQNQDLMNCSPNSIIGSALRAATLELSVDPSIGQAYLVPFKKKVGENKYVSVATLIVGYKGLYHMAIRTGKYRYLNLVDIYEDDNFIQDRTTGNFILKLGDVKVLPEKRSRRDQVPSGYMLYMELLSGFKKTFFMTCEECDDHGKKYSKTYDSMNGLWKKDPHVMYKKTVIRQGITHWGYLDPHDLMNMNQVDEYDEDETDYMKGVEIKEVPRQSVEKNLADLGFGLEPNNEPETKTEKPQKKTKETKQEPVHIVTYTEFWTAVKEKGLSNIQGQDILTKQGGDYNAALYELNK
jgi:recombination protein RecT